MKVQCSYCLASLSFAKGDLFATLAKHDWRVFGVKVEDNSNYYICKQCRELKKINLPLYTPPNLSQAMKEKFDKKKSDSAKTGKEEKVNKVKDIPPDIISIKI